MYCTRFINVGRPMTELLLEFTFQLEKHWAIVSLCYCPRIGHIWGIFLCQWRPTGKFHSRYLGLIRTPPCHTVVSRRSTGLPKLHICLGNIRIGFRVSTFGYCWDRRYCKPFRARVRARVAITCSTVRVPMTLFFRFFCYWK